VGGPGKEFWAAGKNWEINRGDLSPEELAMMGQWRAEVTPGGPRVEDHFLHVIQVGDQNVGAMEPAALVRSDGRVGARLTIGGRTAEITFATRGELGGHIRLAGGERPVDTDLTTIVTPQAGIVVE
jgi:hypothetical protein